MITFDLKSGYHHIEIHPDHLRFLGFAWKFPGETPVRYFVFTVLPFGLSSASARELASLVGRIISGGAVFGNISRIMTRYCSISVASAQDWDSKFHLDQYCVRELYFWETNLKRLN